MPASYHPAPLPPRLPPSALELSDGEVGWGEESAVFELPAPRPARGRAALEGIVEAPPGLAATNAATAFDAASISGPVNAGTIHPGAITPPVIGAASVSDVSISAVPGEVLHGDGVPSDAPPLDDVGRLFSDYRAYVAKIGRRILGPSSEVDDLIQDVFLATVRDAHKIKDPARLAAWLGTVTTRMAKRRRFRSSHYPLANEGLEDLADRAQDDGPGPESSADLSGNIRKLLSLPDELRTPWLLKHVEGHTLEDVARQCDCSLSTAARRIQNASSKLGRGR
jgi:RNA polymerase sigma-70 factor, ECF subfamily